MQPYTTTTPQNVFRHQQLFNQAITLGTAANEQIDLTAIDASPPTAEEGLCGNRAASCSFVDVDLNSPKWRRRTAPGAIDAGGAPPPATDAPDVQVQPPPSDEPTEPNLGLASRAVRRIKRIFLSKDNLLLMALVVSMIVGIGIGIGVQGYKLTPRQLMYVDFPGYLFMRMLKLLILPLVTSSIIVALASLDIRSSGRIGGFAVGYFLATTLLAVFLGIVLAVSIRPGERGSSKSDIANVTEASRISVTEDKILDLIRNVFPDNLVTATFEQTETSYTELKECKPGHASLRCLKAEQILRGNETVFYEFSVSARKGSPNILGLLAFCIAFGITLARMGERGRPLVEFFNALSEASLRLVGWVIWFSPIGVCFLIAAKVAEMDDLLIVVAKLGFYLVTALVGLAIHGFVTLPLIYAVVVRMNPFAYMRRCLQAVVTAFATASSSATLPVTIRCVEENNHVDKRVTSFVLPVGATINMDGTALYEAAAALFIAQLSGLTLSAGEIITTSLTATVASIGAAGVPSGGLVTMIIVLNAIGLPDTDIAYILAVDWLLDRFRTVINVWGDAVGAGIVQHLCRRQLQEAPPATESAVAESLDQVSSLTLHL